MSIYIRNIVSTRSSLPQPDYVVGSDNIRTPGLERSTMQLMFCLAKGHVKTMQKEHSRQNTTHFVISL